MRSGSRKNYPLFFGTILVLSVLFIAIYGPEIAPRDPYMKVSLQVLNKVQGLPYQAPPYRPSADFPLGSDDLGRDVLSRVIYGVRYTLILGAAVAFLRLILAIPLGLVAGWFRGWLETLVRQLAAVFGAVPSLLLSFLILRVMFVPTGRMGPNLSLTLENSVMLYIGVLTLIEWPRVAEQIRARVTEISGQPFIEGAVATGAGAGRIIFRHILPQLGPELVVMTALEISRVLLLVAQLGLFGIYIGGGVYEEIYPGEWIQLTFYPELGSMASDVRRYLNVAPWMVLPPALAFFWIIGSLNLLAEGLRIRLQRFSERTTIGWAWKSLVSFIKTHRRRLVLAAMALGFLWIGYTGLAAVFHERAVARVDRTKGPEILSRLDDRQPGAEKHPNYARAAARAPRYRIDGKFDPAQNRFSGFVRVDLTNTSGAGWREICFHLYPNGQRKDSPLTVVRVDVDGKEVPFEVQGEILKAPLAKPMNPGETLQARVDFEVIVPPASERFGRNEFAAWFGNWYPILAVFDDRGWNLDPYSAVNDAFYSDIAFYEARVRVPGDYTVIATGVGEPVTVGSEKVFYFRTDLVRDFAMVVTRGHTKKSVYFRGKQINYYGYGKTQSQIFEAANLAANSLEYLSEAIGEYPYKELDLVDVDFSPRGPSGMEYPGIVFIGARLHPGWAPRVIVHEIAHQWWYNIVHSNQAQEPWVDESLTNYTTTMYFQAQNWSQESRYLGYMEDRYRSYIRQESLKKAASEAPLRDWELDQVVLSLSGRQVRRDPAPKPPENWPYIIAKPVYEFRDGREVSSLVYTKGVLMFEDIRRQLVAGQMLNFMQEYYRRYGYGAARGTDLIDTMVRVGGTKVRPIFDRWLYTDDTDASLR